jgi:transcriptional regulator with XRE-family HTH domain
MDLERTAATERIGRRAHSAGADGLAGCDGGKTVNTISPHSQGSTNANHTCAHRCACMCTGRYVQVAMSVPAVAKVPAALGRIRLRAGMTQEQAGRALGMRRELVSRTERAHVPADAVAILHLARRTKGAAREELTVLAALAQGALPEGPDGKRYIDQAISYHVIAATEDADEDRKRQGIDMLLIEAQLGEAERGRLRQYSAEVADEIAAKLLALAAYCEKTGDSLYDTLQAAVGRQRGRGVLR